MKNPFLIFEEFISPLQCEEIIIDNNVRFTNVDKDGKVIPLFFSNKLIENRLLPQLVEEVIPSVESHYNVEVEGIKPFTMELYPQGYDGHLKPRCENSVYSKELNKWVRYNDNDFTGILFLNDFSNTPPFDNDFEVDGGRLEFINHGFSFNPVRGNLIIFPGASNFINHTSEVIIGELTQIRFHIVTNPPFMYNMIEYSGNYKTWFNGE